MSPLNYNNNISQNTNEINDHNFISYVDLPPSYSTLINNPETLTNINSPINQNPIQYTSNDIQDEYLVDVIFTNKYLRILMIFNFFIIISSFTSEYILDENNGLNLILFYANIYFFSNILLVVFSEMIAFFIAYKWKRVYFIMLFFIIIFHFLYYQIKLLLSIK